MNPIDVAFQRLRARGKKAFIPFITAGDPNLEATSLLVRSLAGHGASLIEVGFPYSDPIADGPVIQASYTRALASRVKVADIFQSLRKVGSLLPLVERTVPLVAMASYTLIYRRGPDVFLREASDAGISGAIVPDLPIEEAKELTALAAERDFKVILLVTPTTPKERAIQIARASTGFLYCVTIAGITGERDRLPEELLGQLTWLRKQTDLPICVGFGISKPEHVRMLREVADGVIVGSAFVRRLEQAGSRPVQAIAQEIADLAQTLADALNP